MYYFHFTYIKNNLQFINKLSWNYEILLHFFFLDVAILNSVKNFMLKICQQGHYYILYISNVKLIINSCIWLLLAIYSLFMIKLITDDTVIYFGKVQFCLMCKTKYLKKSVKIKMLAKTCSNLVLQLSVYAVWK